MQTVSEGPGCLITNALLKEDPHWKLVVIPVITHPEGIAWDEQMTRVLAAGSSFN
jgi:hypothetical protein